MVTAWIWKWGVYGNISFSHLLEVMVLKLWTITVSDGSY